MLSSRWLPTMVRLTALGLAAYFGPDLVLSVTGRIDSLPAPLMRLYGWGHGGHAVDVMLASVYLVWCVFLYRAARDPLRNSLFLDFTVTANVAHFGAMILMASFMPEDRQHLIGVVALAFVAIVPMAACWLPVRSAQRQRARRQALRRSMWR